MKQTNLAPDELTLQEELRSLIKNNQNEALNNYKNKLFNVFSEEIHSNYENIAREGRYVVGKKEWVPAIPCIHVRHFITDDDLYGISKNLSNHLYNSCGFTTVSIKIVKNNKYGFLMYTIGLGWENSTTGVAMLLKEIADDYNSRSILRDTLPSKCVGGVSIQYIIISIKNSLRRHAKKHGVLPMCYTYDFLDGTAITDFQNSCYRKTMESVIEELPSEFVAVKGTLIRDGKNAIRAFKLEFKFEL